MNLHDVNIIEGNEDADEMEYFTSLQRAINSLEAWKLQGSMGRAMMGAIDGGYCMLGRNPTRDYWGNFIPSRSMIQDGTRGSRGFVVEHMGEDWAKAMEGV